MIDKTLSFVLDELNGFLSMRFPRPDKLAILSSLSNMDGTLVTGLDGKLILTLVNIDKEAAAPALGMLARAGEGGYARTTAPLHLNLYMMLSASFSNYTEALKMLSCALGFFQGRPAFDPQSSASFPPHLEKLTVELVSISTQEMNNLWAILGAKYLPSAVYKLRVITLQQGWTDELDDEVSRPDVHVGGQA